VIGTGHCALRCDNVAGMSKQRTPNKRTRRRGWGTLRNMRSGRIQASYTADDGRLYYCAHTFGTRMDAEGWLQAERKLIDRGEWTPPEMRAKAITYVTFREYAETWLTQRDLTPKTRLLYQDLLRIRIIPGLGDEMLQAVTPAMVRLWWIGLSKDTPTRNMHAYRLLKTIFNTAIEDKLVKENPCQIKAAGRSPKPREVQALTPAELNVVAKSLPERYRVAVYVAAWCGLRFGELIELRRKDIHTVGDYTVLKIRRAAALVDGEIITGNPKTLAGVRDVHVPPHVAEMLQAHMVAHTGNRPESFVFTTTRGGRLTKGAFTKTLKKGYASIGKPEMRIHDLRHIAGTYAARAGGTTKELMARLGHATPAMSLRYQIAAADRDATIADRLSELAR
jgi:integrase